MENPILKSCSVRLTRQEYSKIRIKCSATSSEKGVDLKCHLKQIETNTFSITIKRKQNDDSDVFQLKGNQAKGNQIKTYFFIHEACFHFLYMIEILLILI